MVQGKNRLIGLMPKIGIRPTIDGRERGVRESLELQTMNMAKSAARFLSENLRHANGLPVECVIADTIGGVADAARAEEMFQREGVGVSLTVTPCWCYGTETIDMDPLRPKAIWGFNGTERPGAVYLAAALAAYNQKGLPAFGIYGREIQDADDTTIPWDVQGKLLKFAKAALAAATMRGKSYLAMGGVSMGIGGSVVNEELFQNYLGMRNEYIDMSEFIRRINEGILIAKNLNTHCTGSKRTARKARSQLARFTEKPRRKGSGLGVRGKNGSDRSRIDDWKSKTKGNGFPRRS